MYEMLEAELARIAADFETRVVILTGAGRGFCSGADLKAHRDEAPPADGRRVHVDSAERVSRGVRAAPAGSQRRRRDYIDRGQRVYRALQTLPQPVVAAVNGHAIGAGCELALSSDFVIVAEEAKLRMPEVALGTFIGGGTSYTLRRRVGHARAAELILLGRYFTPEEAGAWGLANQVLPAEEVLPAALDLAGQLARNAPISMRLAKRLLDRAESVDHEEALRLEAEALSTCMASEDWREGLEAFAQKRDPIYRGR